MDPGGLKHSKDKGLAFGKLSESSVEGSFSGDTGGSKSTTSTSLMHLPGSRPQPPARDSANGLNVTTTQMELSTGGLTIEEAEVKVMEKALRMQQPQKPQQNQQLFENFALLEASIADLNRSNTPGSSVLGRPHDLFSLKTENFSPIDKDRLDMGSVSFGQSQKDLDVNERLLGDNTMDILQDLDLPGSLSDLNEFYVSDEAAFLSSLSVEDVLLEDGNMETKPIDCSNGGNCTNVDSADQQKQLLEPGVSMPVIKTEEDADTSFIQLCTPGVIKQENDRRSYCQISSLDLPSTHNSAGSISGPTYPYGANTSTAVSLQQDQKPVFGLYPPLPSVSDSWNRGNGYATGSGMSSSSFPVGFSSTNTSAPPSSPCSTQNLNLHRSGPSLEAISKCLKMLEEIGTKVPISTVLYRQPERPLSKDEATAPKPPLKKARLRFATAHGDKDRTFWRNVLWSDETKIERFGHNDHHYVWMRKGEACKLKNTIPTVKHGTGALHKIDGIMRKENCGYIEATSQDISQEVKAWLQKGLRNGQ
ncbi:unnamed protein product [Oncorhynchus mykiss]|uniref:Uncharacterized protein n=1 Tax=Oncorhynchus mykiss TaxID=8022 RepID=A0A060X6P4_ONCMY|nr:unnamed protein product [Oncorhynchus mykiss]